MNPSAKHSRKNKGQSIVELIFLVPLFLALAIGAIEFSFMLILDLRVSQLSREAANAAIRDCSDAKYPVNPSADLNADGIVNSADDAILVSSYGTNYPAGDLDGNGVVGPGDRDILQSMMGQTALTYGSQAQSMQSCLQSIVDDISNRAVDVLKDFSNRPSVSPPGSNPNFRSVRGWVALTAYAVDPLMPVDNQTPIKISQAITLNKLPSDSRADALIQRMTTMAADDIIRAKRTPIFIAETNYQYSPISPIQGLVGVLLPENLYESTLS